jgi:hypothetical protein
MVSETPAAEAPAVKKAAHTQQVRKRPSQTAPVRKRPPQVTPAPVVDASPVRRGLFAWGNHVVWLGTFGLLFTVFVTTLIQFWGLMSEQDMYSILFHWIQTRAPEGEWASSSMNFAIFAVYGGCLFLLLAALVVFIGLLLSFFSVRGSAWKWLTPFAGLLIGLSVVIAVSLPIVLRFVYKHYEGTVGVDAPKLHASTAFTVRTTLISASAAAVLAAGFFLFYQRGIVRKLGHFKLGWNLLGLFFFIVLSAGLLWALDFVGTQATRVTATDNPEDELAHLQHRALFNYLGFLLWCGAAVVGLIWFLVSNLFVNRAVPRPLPAERE